MCEKESRAYMYECHIIVTNARARSVQQNVERAKWLEKAWETQAIEVDTLQKWSFTANFPYSCNLRLSVCANVNICSRSWCVCVYVCHT
jgi:hypothetical protein